MQQNLEFLNMFITGFTDLIDSFKFSNERFWQHSTADFNKSLKGRVFCWLFWQFWKQHLNEVNLKCKYFWIQNFHNSITRVHQHQVSTSAAYQWSLKIIISQIKDPYRYKYLKSIFMFAKGKYLRRYSMVDS